MSIKVKCMESLCVQYDGTVRDNSDNSIHQFLYGEDGLDVLNVSYLEEMKFIAENGEAFKSKLVLDEAIKCSQATGNHKQEKKGRKVAM